MDDGIIQKVISEHNKNECKCKHACHSLLRIQQELIAEIKKNLMGEEKDDYVIHRDLVLNILIGDNQ